MCISRIFKNLRLDRQWPAILLEWPDFDPFARLGVSTEHDSLGQPHRARAEQHDEAPFLAHVEV